MARMNKELSKLDHIAREVGTVRRTGLTEQLVKKLKSLVLKGVLSPGEKLPTERQLAALLNVSRSTLRQALKALQVMGVIENIQGSGNYLSQASRAILREPPSVLVPLNSMTQAEIFEVRRAMEAETAAAAALRATPADIERMGQEIALMEANTRNLTAFCEHDLAFHNAVAEASGNRYFIWFLAIANKILLNALMLRPAARPREKTNFEHKRLVDAIKAHDPVGARNEILNHLTYGNYYFLDEKVPVDVQFVAYTTKPSSKSAAYYRTDSNRDGTPITVKPVWAKGN